MQVTQVSVGIGRTFDEVYEFLVEPKNFEKWASGLGKGLVHVEDACGELKAPKAHHRAIQRAQSVWRPRSRRHHPDRRAHPEPHAG